MADKTYGVKAVFREDFEEQNKHLSDPRDWVADDAWLFLREAGQPLQFDTEFNAKEYGSRLFLEWGEVPDLDEQTVYPEPPLAWKVVEMIDKTEATWRT